MSITPREKIFRAWLEQHHIPPPVSELPFEPGRKWRFDYAWPEHRVALEIEGGVYTRGRHTRPAGYLKDLEKYNTATLRGWRLLRFPAHALFTPYTLSTLRSALAL